MTFQKAWQLHLAFQLLHHRSKPRLIQMGREVCGPFYVTCKWSSDQTHMLTVVHHNKEKRSRVQGIAYDNPASYRAPLVYEGATLRQLAALADASKLCKQFIKYECFNSVLHSSAGTDYAYWLNRAKQKMSYWGGARPGQRQTCACYNASPRSCADQRYKCNCDINDNAWRADEGYLTDKENLPIAEVRFGDASTGEVGYHTVGPLICTNWSDATDSVWNTSSENHSLNLSLCLHWKPHTAWEDFVKD